MLDEFSDAVEGTQIKAIFEEYERLYFEWEFDQIDDFLKQEMKKHAFY